MLNGKVIPNPKVAWRLGQIRFTVFSTLAEVPATDVFKQIYGFPPDSTPPSPLFPGTQQLFAVKDEMGHNLVVSGLKIDLFFAPIINFSISGPGVPSLPASSEFPSFKSIEESQGSLCRAAKNLMQFTPEVHRIAVSELYFTLVSSQEKGNEIFAALLPIDVKEGSQDFLYRINQPVNVPFQGSNIIVNRLETWNYFSASLNLAAGASSSLMAFGGAVTLTSDVNTAPQSDLATFSAADKGPLIEELFEYSSKMVKKEGTP